MAAYGIDRMLKYQNALILVWSALRILEFKYFRPLLKIHVVTVF